MAEPSQIFDVSINLGNILTIGVFLIGGLMFVMTMKSDSRNLSTQVDAESEASDNRFMRIEAQAEDFKLEMRKLGEVVVDLAKTEGRQNLTDERILAQGKRIDEQGRMINDLLRNRGGLSDARG